MSTSSAYGPCNPKMEDHEIINAYREKKHRTCFRLLHDRYASKIYSKSITMLRDEDEAQDATQEIFTKIFLNLGKFKGNSKFSTWVYSVTYNFCIDKIRKEKRSRELFTTELENPPDHEADEGEDQVMLSMKASGLRKVLLKLNDADRTLLLLKYKDGVKIKDIARMFDKNESAIKMQLKRAKEKAKRIYDAQPKTS